MRSVAVTVIYGPVETKDESDAIERVRQAIDPWWIRTHGHDDRATYVIDPGGLTAALAAIDANASPWWRLRVEYLT